MYLLNEFKNSFISLAIGNILYWHRPHVGQEINIGFSYKPIDESISLAAFTSKRGFSVKETLIVSPIPFRRSEPKAMLDFTTP
ncbi:MAG: hypothetical protein BHW12_07945 [Coprobacillus sp. 28_7]|nr:MAG: hypothetical protein BHW12_07945 [Coprobacillus sp. 28_7]